MIFTDSGSRQDEIEQYPADGVLEEFGDLCNRSYGLDRMCELNTTNLPNFGKRSTTVGRHTRVDSTEEILNFFWTYFPTPLSKSITKYAWLQNKNLYKFNERHEVYKNAVNLFERQVMILSMEQLYLKLQDGDPLFGDTSDAYSNYHTKEESLEKLKYFLNFQLEDNYEHFINFLYEFLNKKSGKQNCLNIIGAPSSGKTYFARIIKEALIISGTISNMSNRSNFPFNNCVNKRVLHWDEPAFDPSALESLKCLFSGDELSVNIKFQDNGSIMRTPVIVTANMNVFPLNEAFNCRIENVRFKSMPELKEWKQLHPLCLYELFIEKKLLKI